MRRNTELAKCIWEIATAGITAAGTSLTFTKIPFKVFEEFKELVRQFITSPIVEFGLQLTPEFQLPFEFKGLKIGSNSQNQPTIIMTEIDISDGDLNCIIVKLTAEFKNQCDAKISIPTGL